MKKIGIVLGSIGALYTAEFLDNKSRLPGKKEQKTKTIHLSYPLTELFKAEKFILREPLKQNLHLSTPFNRKIRSIYSLPFYYSDYENYNFNKLSDLFLNIHIFIN